MKKGKTALQIVHTRPKQDKNQEDSGPSPPSLINPHDALLLFNQMLDQVKYSFMSHKVFNFTHLSLSPVPPLCVRVGAFLCRVYIL